MTKEFAVQFWDFDAWNEVAATRRRKKSEAVALAQEMNRTTPHEWRQAAYQGHRFRVRRVFR